MSNSAATVKISTMTEGINVEPPLPPSPEILQLWTEVGNGIDKNQTVVWKSAVESLSYASTYLETSPDARLFCEKYMAAIIGILVEQQPSKIGPHERSCVQESLAIATDIVRHDLEIQLRDKQESKFVDVLVLIFSKKKAFYKGAKATWNVSHLQGLPEIRLKMIENFAAQKGFLLLQQYLPQLEYPFELWHVVLLALSDVIDRIDTDEALAVAKVIMQQLDQSNDETLKKFNSDQLLTTQRDLQDFFDKLATTRREETLLFYRFWRSLILKLIRSSSLPLQIFGWEQMGDIIDACAEHRPPPKYYMVTGAGCDFVNGIYNFASPVTPEGYSKPGSDILYSRTIPEDEPNGGKKLTLFRCTMRSQQKWWFLSEADEEQPGTDRDIDYYQHKSKDQDEPYPPSTGWITCRSAGVEPPPQLQPGGLVVPSGQEFRTLEHELAKWAIENRIVEQVLGDTTIHREVVARSTVLVKFLASMCTRDQTTEHSAEQPNQYCLQTSHLLFAWKTCTRKADAAVSAQVYQLLVSILPLCPSDRAIPLLRAVHNTLDESQEKKEYLSEVAQFCSTLANGHLVENKTSFVLNDEVREEVLKLLWSVLTHPEASSLKSYDTLKRYVTFELRVEPGGSIHRKKFLESCIAALSVNAAKNNSPVDEVQALRMVKLTDFVLEACPRQQADTIAMDKTIDLPYLLFRELISFLERRKNGQSMFRKASTSSLPLVQSSQPERTGAKNLNLNALNDRLMILRHVYGLSDPNAGNADPIVMTATMLEKLWSLCDMPEDRERLMVFIANASQTGKVPYYDQAVQSGSVVHSEVVLSAAFTEEVCRDVFLDLFCSNSFGYESLGEEAYRSFYYLFCRLRDSAVASPDAEKIALDALWRVCLSVKSERVASRAMKDLMSVYVSLPSIGTQSDRVTESMATNIQQADGFGARIFQHLSVVKRKIDQNDSSVERSTERCLRILNAAIGQNEVEGTSVAPSTLSRLAMLNPQSTLNEVFQQIPHGLRGKASYRKVGVVVKRPQAQSVPNQVSNIPSTLKFTLDIHPLETFLSVKHKVAAHCHCSISAVKPIQINGRSIGRPHTEPTRLNMNTVPDDTVMDELGVVQGCEMVYVISDRPVQPNASGPVVSSLRSAQDDLSFFFYGDDPDLSDRLFALLLDILDSLPWKEMDEMVDTDCSPSTDTHQLIWDFLLAMPTNESIVARVKMIQNVTTEQFSSPQQGDAMDVDSPGEAWSQLLDRQFFNRSVYVLLTIDELIQPAPEALSILPSDHRIPLESQLAKEAESFRKTFIASGGFKAVAKFFSSLDGEGRANQAEIRRGSAVALRILKACLFGDVHDFQDGSESPSPADEISSNLLQSLSDPDGLLKSLTSMVFDSGISSSTVMDVLRFLRLLFQSPRTAQSFVSLPNGMAARFLVTLLHWDDNADATRTNASVSTAFHVRRSSHDLILRTVVLADHSLPLLINTIQQIEVNAENVAEHFDVLEKLIVADSVHLSRKALNGQLKELGVIICDKLASCPRPSSESEAAELSTLVLCGCMKLLRALVENGGASVLQPGVDSLLKTMNLDRWSSKMQPGGAKGVLSLVSSSFGSRMDDSILVDLIGVIFDGFLSPNESSSVAICCDKESRRRGFDVIGAAARSCKTDVGYLSFVARINSLIASAVPTIRHRWGCFGINMDSHSRSTKGSSKYSGLRNQGCTCYMNSLLQQLFMMPELRHSLCSAQLPSTLRSAGRNVAFKGAELIGKKISLQWETGVSYDAIVEDYCESTGMHTIRYCPVEVATVERTAHRQVHPEDVARLPPNLPDEFVLLDGRPGKETGVFEIISESPIVNGSNEQGAFSSDRRFEESEDEAASRHLLEEVQRTFVHLEKGSKGSCFDPRSLVEAGACLKLEFDVWQQNDASEFATKLLDRLEVTLKRWAPEHFRYMDHTFGLKQTKQKICKECGLKTNREEKLLNIDCQIRGKTDIHEALDAMTEVEIMEGSNKVFCDNCKRNTDTILRTALSTLPNMLILSLKRFDLDYNTFETVKLNSRCAFGQTLNLKEYTLEGIEAMERATQEIDPEESNHMELEEVTHGYDVKHLPDEDYEYKLAGVLVHAGVAQGGHYYSFIKDRNPGSEEKWYRFDDDDVTPFDPALIENECFGGKVKKETKWPNGQIQTVEQEQFANALMLFYEKVKPTEMPGHHNAMKGSDCLVIEQEIATSTGYDMFEPDVRRSNATLRCQSFLFDEEFHGFMKGMLGMCRMSLNPQTSFASQSSWRTPVLQMVLRYFFDVMMYSSQHRDLEDWSRMLEETLLFDQSTATTFAHELAKCSKQVSSNWLRTYLLECPDQNSRQAAARIFSSALKACASNTDEMAALEKWTKAWRGQLDHIAIEQQERKEIFPVPTCLENDSMGLENITKIENGATTLGIIISHLSELLDALPRQSRFSSEVALIIRYLATMPVSDGDNLVRRAMLEAQIPARLIALVARDRSSSLLRLAFPGASASDDVAQTQMRAESTPVSHVMSLSGSQGMNPPDLNSTRIPKTEDYIVLLEALCCLGNIPGMPCAALFKEVGLPDANQGRVRLQLTDKATRTLLLVFKEHCSPGTPGMNQRDFEQFLELIGSESGSPSQKAREVFSKYPTTTDTTSKSIIPYLTFEGFLAYYQETINLFDYRLLHDLHVLGFRMDLTRRSRQSIYSPDDEKGLRKPGESVAIDVAEKFLDKSLYLGQYGENGLCESPQLFSIAFNVSEPIGDYLVAAATYRKDCDSLIGYTLQYIYRLPNDWEGSDQVATAINILAVIASVPGNDQNRRISRIMFHEAPVSRGSSIGAGLLTVVRHLQQGRPSHLYNNDVNFAFERYVSIIKEMRQVYSVCKWMDANRERWSFIDREIASRPPENVHGGQNRDGHGPHGPENSVPFDQSHIDSDMVGINDSDDDSHFDNINDSFVSHPYEGPYEIEVCGAGHPAVNGVYRQDGYFENACRYVKEGDWNGMSQRFYIFQCNVSNNTRHWYISVVPSGGNPGTSADIDFYTAPATDACRMIPPNMGWATSHQGRPPCPTLYARTEASSEAEESPERPWNGNIVEPDKHGNDPSPYL